MGPAFAKAATVRQRTAPIREKTKSRGAEKRVPLAEKSALPAVLGHLDEQIETTVILVASKEIVRTRVLSWKTRNLVEEF